MGILNSSLPLPLLEATFWVAAVGCAVAQFFILRAVFRVIPIVSKVHSVPAPRRAQEIAWAILPALMLAGAFVGAWQLMHTPTSSPVDSPVAPSALVAPAPRT